MNKFKVRNLRDGYAYYVPSLYAAVRQRIRLGWRRSRIERVRVRVLKRADFSK